MRSPVPIDVVRTTQNALDAAFAVHTEVGPGCFERVYETCLAKVLRDGGHRVERQVAIPFQFRGERVDVALRADLIVDDSLIIEVKRVEGILPVHVAQLRTYLTLANKPVGLLLCFGAEHLREGYERVVHSKFAFLPPSKTGVPTTSGPSGTS